MKHLRHRIRICDYMLLLAGIPQLGNQRRDAKETLMFLKVILDPITVLIACKKTGIISNPEKDFKIQIFEKLTFCPTCFPKIR